MPSSPSTNPLHGITLAMMLEDLVAQLGWRKLAEVIPVRCFMFDPSVTSSLRFLRRTPWARAKLEELYLSVLAGRDRQQAREAK